jgi:hypothetical protein
MSTDTIILQKNMVLVLLIFPLVLVKKYLVLTINQEQDGNFAQLPLGGYVKFFGDRNVFSQAEQEELLKSIMRR